MGSASGRIPRIYPWGGSTSTTMPHAMQELSGVAGKLLRARGDHDAAWRLCALNWDRPLNAPLVEGQRMVKAAVVSKYASPNLTTCVKEIVCRTPSTLSP